LERKPDLFLFVAESLRKDFLCEETTPSLTQFRKANGNFSQASSVSNATQTSWFSIFYSLYPFYWTQYSTKDYTQGSPCLSLLKKMGYQIHVYSASRLSFYSMKRVLFGENGCLADSLQEFHSDTLTAPYQADAGVIEKLCSDIQASDQKGGRVFIMFLDATHFDYSWPEDKPLVFAPIEEKINYIKMSCVRNDLNGVKNRYKNSLYYMDALFNRFQEAMKKKDLWEDSAVVFTADHGEEFNEYGHMFHASSLSLPQLQIPLYIKLGRQSPFSVEALGKDVSQIDIFPTLFHYIIGEDLTGSFFQGSSLLAKTLPSYAIGTRYNAGRAPYQFYIQSGPYRMILEFVNHHDIFHCNQLKIHSVEDEKGEKVPFSPSLITTYFQEAFNALFGPSCL
jgi:membrane-anchored protein YejM (alkaline phosphatase superfamily)